MAAPSAPTETIRQPLFNLRSVLPEGVIPTNLAELETQSGSDAAIARLNQKAQSVRQPETRPVIETTSQTSKDPAGTAPEPQATPPERRGPDPVMPPEMPKADPTPEPTSELTEAFPEDGLLKALDAPTETTETKKEVAKPTEVTDIEADPESTVEVPKSAKEMQNALITVSKKARELNKTLKLKEAKIAELQASGNIDMAAQAQEPLKARIAELEAHTKQLEGAVSSSSLERRPEFQRLVQPAVAATNYINELAKSNAELDSRSIFAAINIADMGTRKAAVRAACSDLPPDEIAQTIQAVEAIHIINGQVANVRANAAQIEANLKRAEGEKFAAAQAQRRAESVKAHEEVYENLVEKNKPLKEMLKLNPDFQKRFDAIRDLAKAAELDTSYATDPKKLALAIQQSIAFQPTVELHQKQIRNLIAELTKTRAQLVKYTQPAIGISPRREYVAPANNNAPQTTEALVKGLFAEVRNQM